MKVWVATQGAKPIAVFACKELLEAFQLGADTGAVTVTEMDITGFRPPKMLLTDDEGEMLQEITFMNDRIYPK